MFSVRRVTALPPVDGRDVGRGRLEAVPGVPEAIAPPLMSSVFCELIITDLLGSNVSSLCSALLKSQSTEAVARNLSAPSSGSSVLLILASKSCSIFCR